MLLIPEIAGSGEDERSSEVRRVRVGHHRRLSSFSYERLIQPSSLNLSILKLDGSVFDVQVEKNAVVWQLKAAVEEIFYPLLRDEGIDISWSHVWSHFCLCFKKKKLTNDEATIRSFGIGDGDQLEFVQHLSIDYLTKRKCKGRKRLEQRRSLAISPELLTEDETDIQNTPLLRSTSFGEVEFYQHAHFNDDLEDDNDNYTNEREDQIKTGMFFRGWFSYSRIKSSSNKNKPSSKRREN